MKDEQYQYKDFYCKSCKVRFRIVLEPDYYYEVVEKDFPESIKWFRGKKFCPVCMSGLKKE